MSTKLKTKWKLIHIKSKQRGEDGKSPKLPTSDQLQYGELAINYGEGIETIAIRNEKDEIVKFIPEKRVKEYVDKRVNDIVKDLINKFPFGDDTDEASIDSGEY